MPNSSQGASPSSSHITDQPVRCSGLEPCPFCGKGKPNISFEACDPPLSGDHTNTLWTITCWNCSAEISGYDTEQDAISAWNHRTPTQEPAHPDEISDGALFKLMWETYFDEFKSYVDALSKSPPARESVYETCMRPVLNAIRPYLRQPVRESSWVLMADGLPENDETVLVWRDLSKSRPGATWQGYGLEKFYAETACLNPRFGITDITLPTFDIVAWKRLTPLTKTTSIEGE